jgi:hypothetical protein
MSDEVNQYANEGGDTEQETAAEIKRRNSEMQKLSDIAREHGEKLRDARQEILDAHVEAEEQVIGDNEGALTGAPVMAGNVGPTRETARSSSKKSSAPATKAPE